MQPTEGKSVADLATCLRAAYRRVDVGGPTSGPTTGAGRTPRGGELGTVVGEVLTTAALHTFVFNVGMLPGSNAARPAAPAFGLVP